MKIIRKILLVFIVFLSGIFVLRAEDPGFPSGPVPPPPVGLPIDSDLIGLFVVALFLGFCKIYSLIIKKKRSV